ncbi:hypothetical protein KEM48_011185 [Puccinia striiformis f. sp. tritici PST-130]|nr:hypothetical protein KEM48_011185 [Puccinia striiformis f. sp. tritici PST-130]
MAGMESHVQHTAKELDSEQYIAEILNPARKSGLARDREISTLGREVGGGDLSKKRRTQKTMEIAQKMDHIHEKLLEPIRNQIFKLQGKELTDTATHQDDHMTESQSSKVIGDANTGSSDKMQENSENNHTARTSKEKSLNGIHFRTDG